MPTPSQRVLETTSERYFGRCPQYLELGDLTDIQTKSYERFLQHGVPPRERKPYGLEEILRETFPIVSNDGQARLEYIKYELRKPRHTPEECRQLKLTYGLPLHVWLRLVRDEPVEQEVYLCDIPIMLGGGEFIINGAERVVVSQLHRSPGVDFTETTESGDRKTFSCRIIPERGSWIELVINKKGGISVRIDQSGKFPATTLLRAMSPQYSTDADILRAFYTTRRIKSPNKRHLQALTGAIAADDIVYPPGHERVGEIIVDAADPIGEEQAQAIIEAKVPLVEIIEEVPDDLVLNTVREDATHCHEEALLRIYSRLRPGTPPSLDKAEALFHERFFDENRYRLGRVGRFRINRKFAQDDVSDDEMALHVSDYVNAIKYLTRLRSGDPSAHTDDIDNLGNRRLRTIDELATEEIRKGFLKLKRSVMDKMTLKDINQETPVSLINVKNVSAAVDYFFGRHELSQVVDQTNPLSMLTHERRLSALGPGGLNRKRAGFEARDVHISHYGRICPIETPEGQNIGLILSLGIFAKIDEYGFLITPYRKVVNGKLTDEIEWLRADQESEVYVVPADTPVKDGRLAEKRVLARYRNDVVWADAKQVQYIDVAPSQMVGVSASLIPFLEHDDANRALMGSNMQRQAVPLLVTEKPIVGTGMERVVAENSGMVLRAPRSGKVTYVDARRIDIDGRPLELRKFQGLNDRACLNQKPLVRVGERVKKGQILCDSAATRDGELALGRNVLVAFMSWEGYNFEDAIILSERLVKEDVYTSVHIDAFDVEIRETKLGREEFTRDIPNVSEKALRHLDENGIVKVGTRVAPGDILVGKVAPKQKTELTPEEKLLHAIFGRAGEDVKNESLEVPSGTEGIVIHTERFTRRTSLSEHERKKFDQEVKRVEREGRKQIAEEFRRFLEEFEEALGQPVTDESGTPLRDLDTAKLADAAREFPRRFEDLDIRSPQVRSACRKVFRNSWPEVEQVIDDLDRRLNSLRRGDELPNGVLEKVKVYVASKRKISVGDKMAGRHGNKGVIAKILPVEDMPFLEDGTPVDIILNPLGVPSRMNVGQILETHLGWAAGKLGFRAICPVFDGAKEEQIRECLKEAGLPEDGKTILYDGRTGEPFEQKVTVGYIYMLKLHHLVDDKVHARATGPYSLITQQPLGGKARFGGQRFGEMEVWALEAYGAAYILQELLTVKSDDVEGRTKIYESMVKGENTLEAGTPASFDVLTNEIRGLALNLQLEKNPV
ncbi:MAG: DNA-directed RNA polymerase subunit beta [Planctomycetota bacterium]|nr:MAG: DNA-directed RNA polymerase subunit beta [Planctomycetota bacterium]